MPAPERRWAVTLEERIEQYLEQLYCTLWGTAFVVSNPEGRREAAVWFAQQIRKAGLAE